MLRPAPPLRIPPPSATAWLLLPLSVVANGALFWPAACLVAITAAGARHYGAMLVWYGLAVGFDHNALVLAPFVAAVLIGARVRWRLLPLAPVFALAMLLARAHAAPPFLALPEPITLPAAPSLWTILQMLPWIGTLSLGGLALTSAFGTAVAYGAWASTQPLRPPEVRERALLCALAIPMLLPGLDPSAFLLAGGLALHATLLERSAPRRRIAALVGIGMLVACSGGVGAAAFGAIAMIGATLLQARAVLKRGAANDNPAMAWAAAARPLPLPRVMC